MKPNDKGWNWRRKKLIKKQELNWIQKINKRTTLYFDKKKKIFYRSSITVKIIFMFKRSNLF